ncbi:YecA family protein [Fictibacillus fluitans]|uniref:SEC-C metal-binding domain-containing protein n=1 Tax=Fictibacillus fluitans TaxID=3058422 RepID=A0ABT8HWE3_9BACL|nr:SEC-C metal-binding domain-containing protein [Fictibacillus sp. NE201]MDN4525100.1 SEC-C metal-binding domain-containing protein [Fictibacillus sp. NE201]
MNKDPENLLKELIQHEVKRGNAIWKEIEDTSTLEKMLVALTKAELDGIRKLYEFSGISSLNKTKLAHELAQLIPAHFDQILYKLDEERYSFLKKLLKNGGSIPATPPYEIDKLISLKKYGLVFPIMEDGERFIIMPAELMDRFQELDGTELKACIRRNTEWITLTQGMLYYYGVMEHKDIINSLRKLTGKEVEVDDYFEVLRASEDYYGEIEMTYFGIKDLVIEDADEVIKQQEMRPDLDYCPFTKQQLLKAGEPEYVEWTPAMKDVKQFIQNNYDVPSDEADAILGDFSDQIKSGGSLNDIILFIQEEFEFPNAAAFQEMVDKAVKLYNTTPQWALKGYSPAGLGKGQETSEAAPDVTYGSNVVPFRAPDKTGRNEPCPCGSGKKYKKCCGK